MKSVVAAVKVAASGDDAPSPSTAKYHHVQPRTSTVRYYEVPRGGGAGKTRRTTAASSSTSFYTSSSPPPPLLEGLTGAQPSLLRREPSPPPTPASDNSRPAKAKISNDRKLTKTTAATDDEDGGMDRDYDHEDNDDDDHGHISNNNNHGKITRNSYRPLSGSNKAGGTSMRGRKAKKNQFFDVDEELFSNEYRIKRRLLKNYDKNTRPVRNDTTPTKVYTGMSLYHILDTVFISSNSI